MQCLECERTIPPGRGISPFCSDLCETVNREYFESMMESLEDD